MSFKGLQGKWGDWKCGVTTNGLSDSTITRYIRLYEFSLKEENRSVLTEKSLYEIYEIMRGTKTHSGGKGSAKPNRPDNNNGSGDPLPGDPPPDDDDPPDTKPSTNLEKCRSHIGQLVNLLKKTYADDETKELVRLTEGIERWRNQHIKRPAPIVLPEEEEAA